jgi:hypothetical protein
MSKWLEGDRFQNVSGMIESLCVKYDLPVPIFFGNCDGDLCDYTNYGVIRLFVKGDLDYSYEYHAKHVFTHYLCNLEQTEISDKVVDIIINGVQWS